MKLLWVGDYLINSGFSQVSHNICAKLGQTSDVVVYAINYDGSSLAPRAFKVYPGINKLSYNTTTNYVDIYGFDGINHVISTEKPDITVLFNDLSIINKYIDAIVESTQLVALFPINNLPIVPEQLLRLSVKPNKIIKAITYTDWAREECLKINPMLDPLACYHGVDKSIFRPMENAKRSLGLPDKSFVVGCVNTNTIRKRLDLTLQGFAKFAENKEDVFLLLHHQSTEKPYNLVDLARRYGILGKVVFSTASLASSQLNILYNAMDLQVSTTTGEGFGLPLAEGAACKVPILCTDLPALRDIWKDSADFINVKYTEVLPFENCEGSIIDVSDYVNKLEQYYSDVAYRVKRGENVYHATFDSRFNWDKITQNVRNSILAAYYNGIKVIE